MCIKKHLSYILLYKQQQQLEHLRITLMQGHYLLPKTYGVDYGQIVNWPGKSKSNKKKKVWKLLWKTKTCWHPASDLSFSKRCNCDHLEYWFPMGHAIYVPALAAKIVIIWGVQTCYEYQRCSFHFFHGWCYWAFQAHDLLQGMVSDGQHIHNSILISGQSSW